MLAELVRKNQVNINTTKAAEPSQGMMASLAVMELSWAAKAGLNYVVQQMTTAASKKKNPNAAPVAC